MKPFEAMKRRTSRVHLVLAIWGGAVASLGLCGSVAAQSPADVALKTRIEAALEAASDLPADGVIAVEVSGGTVTLTGSVACNECGGRRTPGFGAVQQSLGAVVRAIPGVERVEFELEYVPPSNPPGSGDR